MALASSTRVRQRRRFTSSVCIRPQNNSITAYCWATTPVSCTSVSASTVGRLANGVCEQSTSGLLQSLNRGVDASSGAIGKVDPEAFGSTLLPDPLTLFIGRCEMYSERRAGGPRRPGEHGR
jgi:hypothetical protein